MTTSVRIATISLVVTACLLVIKLVLGIISDSIAVISDGIDSATDLAAGTAALLSVRIAAQPADQSHPFGHGKIESISAAVAATVVGLGGGFVTYQAVNRLVEGSPEIDVGVGMVAIVIAGVANIVIAYFMRREAVRADSMALRAESTHLMTNVVQAAAIFVGLVLVWITDEEIFDPLVALGLAAYMGFTAVGLIRHAVDDIMDRSLPPEDLRAICRVLVDHKDEVRGFHQLRTRRSGPVRQIDVHITLDPETTVDEAHRLCERIGNEIRKALPNSTTILHTEPDHGEGEQSMEELVEEVMGAAVSGGASRV
jgi:cation diffusion facilitator family transporter